MTGEWASNTPAEPQPKLNEITGSHRPVVIEVENGVGAAEELTEMNEVRCGHGAVAVDVAEEAKELVRGGIANQDEVVASRAIAIAVEVGDLRSQRGQRVAAVDK